MFEENEISEKSFGGTELTKRGLAKHLDPALLDNFQIICSRVRSLEPNKIRVYWVHDTEADPETTKIKDPGFRDNFHKIVFTSEYQYQRFQQALGIPYSDKFMVIESAIEPIEEHTKPDDKINLIYMSTPQRGLQLLIPAFDHLSKLHDNIHLHVFSSFKQYGWDDMDKQFDPLYEQCRNHEKITYHEFSGAKSNDDVREQLKQSHILAYPCIWPETFCRVVVEAMSAKLLCVHPNFAALPFTSGGLNIMYQGDQDHQKHVNIFAKHLEMAIQIIDKERTAIQPRLIFNKSYVDTLYSMENISKKWTMLMNQLIKEFPTEESRKIPAAVFRYSTQP